jgi:hypothetical protein
MIHNQQLYNHEHDIKLTAAQQFEKQVAQITSRFNNVWHYNITESISK